MNGLQVCTSELDVELEAEGKDLGLLVGNDVLEREAGCERGSHSAVDLVLEEGINVAAVVDLELAGGLLVELVRETKAGLEGLGLPVEGELSANNLRGGSSMVHKEEKLANLNRALALGLVLESNESVGGRAPVKTPVVLVNVLFLGVDNKIGSESKVVLYEIAEGNVGKKGSCIEEKLTLGLLVSEIKSEFPVVLAADSGS